MRNSQRKAHKPRETPLLVGSPYAMLKLDLGATTAGQWEGRLGPIFGAGTAWEEGGRGREEVALENTPNRPC